MAYKEAVEYQKVAQTLNKTLSEAAKTSEKIFSKSILENLKNAGDYVDSFSETLKKASDLNFVDISKDLDKVSKALSTSAVELQKSFDSVTKAEEVIVKAEKELADIEKKRNTRQQAFNQNLVDQNKALQEQQNKLKTLGKDTKEYKDTLKDIQAVRERITKMVLQNSENSKQEKDAIKAQNDLLEEQNKIREENKNKVEEIAQSIEKAKDSEKENLAEISRRIRSLTAETDYLSRNVEGTFLDPDSKLFTGQFDKSLDRAKGAIEDIGDSLGQLASADFNSLATKGTNVIEALGKRARMYSEKRRMDMAKLGKESGILSKASGGMGKFLLGFGGVAAGAMAVVSAVQAVEEKIKGANKELIEAYGASDLLADGMGSVEESVNQVRKDLNDADFANSLGVTLDESRQLVTSLNEIGLNVRTMNGDMAGLKDITMGFQAASRMLGVGFSEVAGFAQNFREELGIAVTDGHLLGRMADEFGQIRDMAMQSSFSTNRFFQIIQSLTEGIGSMNVRVGEAGKLFVSLSKVLGPKAAQQFAQGLTEGFKGEGIQDRFKRIILTGGAGKMRGIFKRTADATQKDMEKNFSESQNKILREAGGLENIKTEKQLKEVMRQLRNTEGGAGASQQLMRSFNLRKAAGGGMNEQALAMGDMDMSGTLSAQMSQVYAFLGKKGFEGISAIELEALANYTGKSIDELMELKKLDFAYQADFQKAQEVLAANKGKSDEDVMAALKKEGIENVKVKGGQLVSESGHAIDSIDSFVQAQGATLDALGTTQMDQLSMLGEVRNATLTSADMINNHLGAIMQDVGGQLDFLTGFLTKGNDGGLKERKELASQIADEVKGSRELLSKDKTKAAEADDKERRRIAAIEDPKAKMKALAEYEEKKKKSEEEMARKEAEISMKERAGRALISSEMMGVGGTPEEIRQAAMEKAKETAVRTQVGRAAVDRLEGEGAGISALAAQITGVAGTSGAEIQRNLLAQGITPEQQRAFARAGVDTKFKTLTSNDTQTKNLGVERVEERSLNLAEKSGKGAAITASGITKTTGKGLLLNRETGRHDVVDGTTVVDTEATGAMLANELQASNVELSRIKEALDNQNLSEADRKKYVTEQAEINARILGKDKQYQEATGKTYTDAILAAERKKTEAQIGSYLNNSGFQFTGDRTADLATLESLKLQSGMTDEIWNKLREQVRMYQGYDMQFDPMSDRPILLRRGAAVIGQTSDTAYFKDNTVGGGGGGAVASNNSNIVININGGDENRIFKIVQDAIRRNREAVV